MCTGSHPWKSWVCVESEVKGQLAPKMTLLKLFLVAATCPGQVHCSLLTWAAASHRSKVMFSASAGPCETRLLPLALPLMHNIPLALL